MPPSGPRTRFAPSPTGHLHLGHVLHALHVWGLARDHGGRVVLRMEDHDRTRSRTEFERSILDDLAWLGFVGDEGDFGPGAPGPNPHRQSDNPGRYLEAIATLRTATTVYACECNRRAIAERAATRSRTHAPPGTSALELSADDPARADAHEIPYDGYCRSRGLLPGPGRGLRAILPDGVERFDDLRLGPQEQEPTRQCGDLLLVDRDGCFTYQLSVVVDDIVHGVDLVVRGEDLLASTGRQIALARLLRRQAPPRFCHHALLRGPDGRKLSKANGDTAIGMLRRAGVTPKAVLHTAGRPLGTPAFRF